MTDSSHTFASISHIPDVLNPSADLHILIGIVQNVQPLSTDFYLTVFALQYDSAICVFSTNTSRFPVMVTIDAPNTESFGSFKDSAMRSRFDLICVSSSFFLMSYYMTKPEML